jgi:hypothetical protein
LSKAELAVVDEGIVFEAQLIDKEVVVNDKGGAGKAEGFDKDMVVTDEVILGKAEGADAPAANALEAELVDVKVFVSMDGSAAEAELADKASVVKGVVEEVVLKEASIVKADHSSADDRGTLFLTSFSDYCDVKIVTRWN